MSTDEAYLKHEKIGFPELSAEDQCRLLIRGDVKILNNLTPGYRMRFIPTGLFQKYITISRETFKSLFESSGYIEQLNEAHRDHPKRDGEWVEPYDDGRFELKVQERGSIVHGQSFPSFDAVVDYYVSMFYNKAIR